jgi:hypothetical protein
MAEFLLINTFYLFYTQEFGAPVIDVRLVQVIRSSPSFLVYKTINLGLKVTGQKSRRSITLTVAPKYPMKAIEPESERETSKAKNWTNDRIPVALKCRSLAP